MAEPVDAPIRTDDPSASNLQIQIEDLRQALQEWRRKREYSQATEERLAKITVQCAQMVESWQQMEQQRSAATATGDLGEAVSSPDSDLGERLRVLDRTIEHEWEAFPQGDVRATLAESVVAAAELTMRGFARAETRLAALEQDLQGRMAQLSSDLQSVVSELRTARTPQRLPGATAFPLDSVMRIHEELRESGQTAAPAIDAPATGPIRALTKGTEPAPTLAARLESLERAVAVGAGAGPDATALPRDGWRPLYLVIGLVVALAGVALFGLWMQRRVDARLNDAALRVAAAERQRDAATEEANTRLTATRDEAARQVAAARESAAQAQIVGNMLAAPDLVRYWMVDPTSRAQAQLMFSRSRGIVFSASRLPAPGAGKTYQLWLLTRGGPVSAGLLTPDEAGRVTIAKDVVPLSADRRLIGAVVTLEPAGGSSQPSADRKLIRVE